MSSKRDSVAQRLKSLLDEEKSRKIAEGVEIAGGILGNHSVGMLNADPILNRARALSDAVFLRPEETALAKAFRYFELDPERPEHWHLLISYLSRSHFETKPAGRRREWTAERYLQLLRDLYLATKNVSDLEGRSRFKQIRQLMIDDPAFGERYSDMKQDALAKQIDNLFMYLNRAPSIGTGTA
ncbi:hypothetical protein JQ597_12900 [Bradyrhizobium sp. AUGA SZCCT0177]|uniref:hypothetical protein n=1 Tax=Bradyrhizobium sp. AUGA SZCCT0177 TaxID=2807665 RepID=UPI001BAB9E50|nr:hypothetical protein [Bradyrhizobium sp. AUGA SZCCT0177]MBR1282940.1 hypothetical protein [Bradyrhizobium sp. AUGA SZCCT0177]